MGLWTIALAMFAAASLAMSLGVIDGWTGAEYRVYWLFGAVLNVPLPRDGRGVPAGRRRGIAHALFALLLVGTAFAAWKVAGAPISRRPGTALPLGKDVFGDGSAPYRLSSCTRSPPTSCCWAA